MLRNKLGTISADGNYGLNWGTDGVVDIVDMKEGVTVRQLWESNPVGVLRAAFSRDMRRILCFCRGGSVAVWTTPKELSRKPYTVTIIDAIRCNKEIFSTRYLYSSKGRAHAKE